MRAVDAAKCCCMDGMGGMGGRETGGGACWTSVGFRRPGFVGPADQQKYPAGLALQLDVVST